jgi:hypothetical protein
VFIINSFGASAPLNLYALSIPHSAAVVNPFSCTFVRSPYTFARSLSLLFIFFLRPRAFYYGKHKQPTKGEGGGKANPLPPPEWLQNTRREKKKNEKKEKEKTKSEKTNEKKSNIKEKIKEKIKEEKG